MKKYHLGINIQGLLNRYKEKIIDCMEDEGGRRITDKEARAELARRQELGHKLICTSNECEGYIKC